MKKGAVGAPVGGSSFYCNFAPRRILALFGPCGWRQHGESGGYYGRSTRKVGSSGGGVDEASFGGFGAGIASPLSLLFRLCF